MADRRSHKEDAHGPPARTPPGAGRAHPVAASETTLPRAKRARLRSATSPDDAAIAHLIAVADPRAAATLWEKYATLVRGLLRRTLGPCADVEDLVHDAFIGLFRTLPGLRDPDALRSFVVGTALRVARSEIRRRRVRRCLSLTPTGAMPDAVLPGASDPEARRAVKRLYEMLAKVDARGRVAFVLRHIEGCDLGEVAAALGCSVATAKRVLARADEQVKAMLKRDPLLAAYARTGTDADEDREEVVDAAE